MNHVSCWAPTTTNESFARRPVRRNTCSINI